MISLEGVSFGFQLGGQATDFVLLVMDERGGRSILSGKVKIGGDAAAAAGPVGRDMQANLDIYLRTSILTYSRSRGLFAAYLSRVRLCAPTTKPMKFSMERSWGENIVLEGVVPPPASAEPLIFVLKERSPTNQASNGAK